MRIHITITIINHQCISKEKYVLSRHKKRCLRGICEKLRSGSTSEDRRGPRGCSWGLVELHSDSKLHFQKFWIWHISYTEFILINICSPYSLLYSSKLSTSPIYYPWICLKLQDEWQTVQTLIRRPGLRCLIWVYTVCSGLLVPILRIF